jgi:hypothetical protein
MVHSLLLSIRSAPTLPSRYYAVMNRTLHLCQLCREKGRVQFDLRMLWNDRAGPRVYDAPLVMVYPPSEAMDVRSGLQTPQMAWDKRAV